jgi:anti-sigma regulatory factor (Ser/Thr protein kinase)
MWRFDATARPIAMVNGDATRAGVPVRRMEVAIGAGLDAPAMARAAIAPWLASRVSEKLLGDAQLLLSELVTNSVVHAQLPPGAAIRISVEISDGFVHLEVEDSGAGTAVAAQRPDRERGGGFGLFLVETLAERWGSRHEGGTCVWAELAMSAES